FMYSAYQSMAYLAKKTGKPSEEKVYLSKAGHLKENINNLLFSEELNAFCDFDKNSKKFTGHLSPMSFIPLFADCADKD
ncbi:trehalase family glycosidase, partial [Klebsiella pneumoniae]